MFSKTVKIDWIDSQINYLTSHLGIYRLNDDEFFFEPTPGFYGFISQGTTESLNEAIKILSNFIASPTAPIIEKWKGSENPLTNSNYDFLSDDTPPGFIKYNGPYHSRIELNITNKHSPFIMGAILAHELTHHFLDSKNIHLTDVEENERLTDLATAYLGLGKLTLNGYEPLTWSVIRKDKKYNYSYTVGYLNSYDMALIHNKISLFRHINSEKALANLTDTSLSLVNEANNEINIYNRKKDIRGQRFCPHCSRLTLFEINDSDNGLYCSSCGWEWFAMQNIINSPRESFLKKAIKKLLKKY
jgi:hypothetical protein